MARRFARVWPAWKVALFAGSFMALAFVVFGSISQGFSIRTVSWLGFAGAMLGAVAAPTFEPAAFRHPVTWQVIFCVAGLEVVAFFIRADPLWHLAAVGAGTVLGATARYWVEYVNPP